MIFNSDANCRRSLRLNGYDYSQAGVYFLTICAQNRACLFGEVVHGAMQLNDAGHRVFAEWNALPERFPTIELDVFILMPNHLHAIIFNLENDFVNVENDFVNVGNDFVNVGAGLVPALSKANTKDISMTRATTRVAPTIGAVVGAFKSITTIFYARGVKKFNWPKFNGHLWQRNYYEHIIRSENSLRHIQEYIYNNPLQWAFDRDNPVNILQENNI